MAKSSSPRTVLDETRRKSVLSLLTLGCSRRVAARYVGCSPSTISRTAARDPQFAEAVARAEQSLEILALRTLNQAAYKEQYWRAAAWIVERRNPEDFGARPPRAYTGRQMLEMFARATDLLAKAIPEENRDKVAQRLTDLINEFELGELPILVDEFPAADAALPSEPPSDADTTSSKHPTI